MQFKHLKILELNQVQNFNLEHILEIARGGQLKQLFCNVSKLTSTLYQPTSQEYSALERIYQTLRNELYCGNIGDNLEIFLHQVRLGNNCRVFNDFGFDEQLACLYFLNWVAPAPDTRPGLAECASVLEVDYASLYEFMPGLAEDDLRLDMLYVGFPNLQHVILDNSTAGLNGPKLAIRFQNFLQRCKALTELTMKNTKFHSSFYKDLSMLDSLRSLNTLNVFERTGFAEAIDFRFLQRFEYLRSFSTNLANRRETLDILNKMCIRSEFRFIYQHSLGTPRNQLVARLVSSLQRDDRIRLIFFADPNFPGVDYGTMKLDHLWRVEDLMADVFYNPEYNTFFRHWRALGEPFD